MDKSPRHPPSLKQISWISGVAGPLAARGGGQICPLFVLSLETGKLLKHVSRNVNSNISTSILVSS